MGIARRATHWTPQRLTPAKTTMIPIASGATGMPGRYHCWIAEADRSAVSPQVGTQPHQ